MDEIFERILADLKKLLLDEGLPEETCAVLSDSYDAVAVAYEITIDRRIEGKVGKAAYQAMLIQEGLKPNLQDVLAKALGGQPQGGDLPN